MKLIQYVNEALKGTMKDLKQDFEDFGVPYSKGNQRGEIEVSKGDLETAEMIIKNNGMEYSIDPNSTVKDVVVIKIL